MADFTAKARVPTRPLSFDNIDLAVNKELIVNYNTGNVYVKDINGVVHDISKSIKDAITEDIKDNPGQIVDNIKIEITDPDTGATSEVAIDKAIVDLYTNLNDIETNITSMQTDINTSNTKINQIKESVNSIDTATKTNATNISNLTSRVTTAESNINTLKTTVNVLDDMIGSSGSIEIAPSLIKTDTSHQFVTQEQLNKIAEVNNKVGVSYQTLTIPVSSWTGSEAPYTATVSASWAKASMNRPTMDLVASTYFATAEKEVAGYAIYKAVTANGSITFYNMVLPEVALTLQFELKS